MALRHDRFAFEEAEKILDDFAANARAHQFKRAYRKLKFMVSAYAYCDFWQPGMERSLALSYAWEDAEMAFIGYGEPCLTGPIMQMWLFLNKYEVPQFKKAATLAFERANASTGMDVPRRYLTEWRDKPVRTLDDGFDLPTTLPLVGVKLREWAVDSSEDSGALEEQFYWLQQADIVREKEKAQEKRARGHLRLLKNEEKGGKDVK